MAQEVAGPERWPGLKRGLRPRAWLRALRREPIGALSALLLVVVCLTALFASAITRVGPNVVTGITLGGPSRQNWLGTDQFGRDLFSRLVYGARTSLAVGLVATASAALGATIIGVTCAYLGGWLDIIVQRVADAVQALPPIVFLVGLAIALRPGFRTIVLVLAVRGAIVLSRIVRSSALAIKDLPFIDSARSVGVSGSRLMWRHILPNIVPVLIVVFSVNISTNIIAEATLSFLGYGIQPPNPSWGSMMSGDSRLYMMVAPRLLIAPVIALGTVVFATNMLGDTVRDRLDPRLRRQ
jgi:peptide/nickel transport system permease protein